jgi:hypothetical protein
MSIQVLYFLVFADFLEVQYIYEPLKICIHYFEIIIFNFGIFTKFLNLYTFGC